MDVHAKHNTRPHQRSIIIDQNLLDRAIETISADIVSADSQIAASKVKREAMRERALCGTNSIDV